MKVLFVCTGNICRSPTAERLFLHRAAELGLDGRVAADSAGVSDEEQGNPIDRRAVAEAARRGVTLPDRRARRITRADFQAFDLVLGMTTVHLSRMEAAAPADATARTGLLLDYAPALGLRDVPDPWYGGRDAFVHAFDLIEAGVDGLLKAIATGALSTGREGRA
ncbi:MAG: low molecular weight protein-tyrosine-phosphatase [Azospirillaceae bacterium]